MNANQFAKNAMLSGMTFDPAIDCRNDLVNFYGYTREQVSKMSNDELFAIMDRIEAAEKGYDYEDDSQFDDNNDYIDFDECDMIHEMILSIDNACYNKHFEKANRLAKETHETIMNSTPERQSSRLESLVNKLNYLTNRYEITFNLA